MLFQNICIEANTINYYYRTLSDESSNDNAVSKESSKLKRKRDAEDNFDRLFDFSKNKKKSNGPQLLGLSLMAEWHICQQIKKMDRHTY